MTYEERVHRFGRLTASLVLAFIFLVPTVISIHYQIWPPINNLLIGIGTVCMFYIPIAIAEFMTYTPMLGTSASYLVFVTGNLTNLKIPCALTCIENAKVKPQSEEAEVIATIGVAVASLVTTAIIFIGMLTIVPLRPILESDVLKPAFAQIIPALFGAMGGYWILKKWQLAVAPLVIVLIVYMSLPIPAGAEGGLIPIVGLLSVLSAKFIYKRGWVKSMD